MKIHHIFHCASGDRQRERAREGCGQTEWGVYIEIMGNETFALHHITSTHTQTEFAELSTAAEVYLDVECPEICSVVIFLAPCVQLSVEANRSDLDSSVSVFRFVSFWNRAFDVSTHASTHWLSTHTCCPTNLTALKNTPQQIYSHCVIYGQNSGLVIGRLLVRIRKL